MTDTQEATTPAKAKKRTVCKRVYIDAAGGESSHASAEAIALEFRFVNGPTQRFEVAQFPENIQVCFGWNGLSQSLGDKFAGLSGKEAAEAQAAKAADYMDGDWIKPGEGVGVASTVFFEVFSLQLQAEGKKVLDTPEGVEKVKVYCKGLSREQRKAALATPEMAVLHSEYKQRKEADKLKTLKAAAKGAEKSDLGTGQFT